MKVRLRDFGTLPAKAHATDAGFDLYAPETIVVPAHGFSNRVNLGFGIEIPAGHAGFVMERSSQGKVGVFSAGPVVDHGYTGDVHLTLGNMSDEDVVYQAGDRVAQLVVFPIADVHELEVVESLSGDRGDNGHGSTGR